MAQRQMDEFVSRKGDNGQEGQPPPKKALYEQVSDEEEDSIGIGEAEEADILGAGDALSSASPANSGQSGPSTSVTSPTHATCAGPLRAAAGFDFGTVLRQLGWKPPTLPASTAPHSQPQSAFSLAAPSETGAPDWTQDEVGAFETQSVTQEPDPLEEIFQFYSDEEKLGEEVPASAANLVNKALRSPIPSSREKEMLEKILRPRNCPSLVIPRVNTKVWRALSRRTRETELSLQKTHALLNKGLTPLLHTLTSLKAKKDQENLRRVLDAFQLLALSSYNMSTSRRAAMSHDLQAPYKQLCMTSKPFDELLFGEEEELERTLKQLKDSQASPSLGFTYGNKTPYRGRGNGTARGRGQAQRGQPSRGRGQGQTPFLGGKAPHHRRRGGQGQRQATPAAQQQRQPDPQPQ